MNAFVWKKRRRKRRENKRIYRALSQASMARYSQIHKIYVVDVLFHRLNFLAYKSFRHPLHILRLKYVTFFTFGMTGHGSGFFVVPYSTVVKKFFSQSAFSGAFFSLVKSIFAMISYHQHFSNLFSIRAMFQNLCHFHPFQSNHEKSWWLNDAYDFCFSWMWLLSDLFLKHAWH